MSTTRRDFIKKTAAATMAASIAPHFSFSLGANEKIVLGLIGCRGIGWANLNSHLEVEGVEFGALCDVDDNVLQERAAEYEEKTGKKPELYKDYRKLLENKDIDGVIVATPDHWHCLQTIHALEAGKDVYVEKPLANSVQECRLMEEAVKKYNKVVQVGQQQRSHQHWYDAIKVVQGGDLGNIRLVKAWAYQAWMKSLPVKPDGEAPPGVDYAMWLGPAPSRPFNPNRFHFSFRWFWDYAGGLMTDWGVHLLDIALWGMNTADPESVTSIGGQLAYPGSAMETPDTQQTIYKFKDFSVLWECANGINLGPYQKTHGVAFIGENGTLVINREGWEIIPERELSGYERFSSYRMAAQLPIPARGNSRVEHSRNFINAIRNGEALKCDIEAGSQIAQFAHLGNIAYRTGRHLAWDPAKAEFKNDPEANEMLKVTYHSGWEIPKL